MSNPQTIAIVGGTGRVGRTYIEEFPATGLRVKVLARSPEQVGKRYPSAETCGGSMMEHDDVAGAMEVVDAAFLITPIGGSNDSGPELIAAGSAIKAAQTTGLAHLFYASQVASVLPGLEVTDLNT